MSLLQYNRNTPSVITTLAVIYVGWHVLFYLILVPKARAKLAAEQENPPSKEEVHKEAGDAAVGILILLGIALAVFGLLFGFGGGSCSGIGRYSC